jgi:hypothetical protein
MMTAMSAELPDDRTPPLPLTVTGGDGDGDRTGYWTVTGPQDPLEVSAGIERCKSPDDGHVFFAWYLTQRTRSQYSTNTYMKTIAEGFCATYEEAMVELGKAWVREIGER